MADARTRRGGGEGSGNRFGTHARPVVDDFLALRERQRQHCAAGKHDLETHDAARWVRKIGGRRLRDGERFCLACHYVLPPEAPDAP